MRGAGCRSAAGCSRRLPVGGGRTGCSVSVRSWFSCWPPCHRVASAASALMQSAATVRQCCGISACSRSRDDVVTAVGSAGVRVRLRRRCQRVLLSSQPTINYAGARCGPADEQQRSNNRHGNTQSKRMNGSLCCLLIAGGTHVRLLAIVSGIRAWALKLPMPRPPTELTDPLP